MSVHDGDGGRAAAEEGKEDFLGYAAGQRSDCRPGTHSLGLQILYQAFPREVALSRLRHRAAVRCSAEKVVFLCSSFEVRWFGKIDGLFF